MDKEIHFYESNKVFPNNCNILHDWESVKQALEDRVSQVHTTQMCMLSSHYMQEKYGYRLFVHQGNGIVYEITLRTKDNTGYKTVRHSQNVYAMWAGDIFRE